MRHYRSLSSCCPTAPRFRPWARLSTGRLVGGWGLVCAAWVGARAARRVSAGCSHDSAAGCWQQLKRLGSPCTAGTRTCRSSGFGCTAPRSASSACRGAAGSRALHSSPATLRSRRGSPPGRRPLALLAAASRKRPPGSRCAGLTRRCATTAPPSPARSSPGSTRWRWRRWGWHAAVAAAGVASSEACGLAATLHRLATPTDVLVVAVSPLPPPPPPCVPVCQRQGAGLRAGGGSGADAGPRRTVGQRVGGVGGACG